MKTHDILHIIRNPWGWSEEGVRAARLAAADLIEQQAKEIAALRTGDTCGRSCEGQAYRIELRQALAKVEWQAKQIEALQTEVDRLRECWKVDRAELTRRDNLDALNRRIDSYFER